MKRREEQKNGEQLYLSVNDLSDETSIRREDIISTLQVRLPAYLIFASDASFINYFFRFCTLNLFRNFLRFGCM